MSGRFVALLIAGGLALGASAQEFANPSTSFQHAEGELSFEMTASGNTTSTFSSAATGRILTLVAIPGEKNDLSNDPEAPPRALDIKIADQAGSSLAVQSGTGHLADKTWKLESELPPESVETRTQDLADLASFADALERDVTPGIEASDLAEWSWVVDQLVSLMRYIDAERTPTDRELEAIAAAPTATYTNVVRIRKKPTLIIAEHSSLSSSLYTSSGSLLHTLVTCNHGACATASSMSTKCTKTFTQSTVNLWASDLLCDFYGWPYGTHHLCHNDTRVQYLSIKNRQTGHYNGCVSPRVTTPSCD